MLLRTLLSMIALTVAFFVEAHNESRCEQYEESQNSLGNQRYKRVVVLSQDYIWPGPSIPLDPNHQQALNLRDKNGNPFYVQAELNQMDIDGLTEFKNKFGIDLLAINPDSQGIRAIPNLVTYIPSIIGANKKFFIIEDTQHPERGLSDRWYDVEVGGIIVVSANASYTVPSEYLFEGANLVPNSLYSYGELNFVKNNSNKREIIRYTTDWLSLQSTDQWGNRSFAIATVLTDDQGRKGNYLAATAVLRKPDSTAQGFTNYLEERPVLTWDCPTNCHSDND